MKRMLFPALISTVVGVMFSIGAQSTSADASSGGMATAKPETVGMSSERLARIGPAMQRYIDSHLVPGTITAVMRRGKLVHFQMHGDMDVENEFSKPTITVVDPFLSPL